MNRIFDFPNPNSIEQEAAEWVARLDAGALSPEDLRDLRRWALEHPAHRKALNDLAAEWDSLDVLALRRPTEPALRRFSRRWKVGAVAAAAAVVSLVIGYLMTQPGEAPRTVEAEITTYFTAIGEQRWVDLPDGSIVRINTNSRLQVSFSDDARDVILQQGEAYFEVAASSRPFVVTAGRGYIAALGTAFAVRLSDNNVIKVDVTEGSVVVTTTRDFMDIVEPDLSFVPEEGTSRVVHAGDVVHIGESIDLVRSVEPILLERELAWRDGMLVFDGDSLENVIAEVSRYTSVEIVIAEPTLRNLKIGGYFRTGDTDILLSTLESSFAVEVDYIRPDLVYIRQATR